MNREEALKKIKSAYENKELGFQKGAKGCYYYDPISDSCCVVGILVKDSNISCGDGYQRRPFKGNERDLIDVAMRLEGIDELHGLTIYELKTLQGLHDDLIQRRPFKMRRLESDFKYSLEENFKNYLYSL